MHEAEEALAALQVLDEGNEGEKDNITFTETNSSKIEDGLLHSLKDIEPQQYFAIPIVDDNDSLALLSSDILDLFSNDPNTNTDSPSIVSQDNQEDTEDRQPSMLPEPEIEKNTATLDNSPTATTNTNTTLAADSLPEIEIDFGGDPFLINSDQLHSVFDLVDPDTESREDNDVGSQDEEGRRDRLDLENIDFDKLVGIVEEEQESYLPSLVEYHPQQQQDEGELLQHPIVEDFPVDVDLETEELYNELAKMSLTETTDATASGTFNKTETKSSTRDEKDENSPSNDQNKVTTSAGEASQEKEKADKKKKAMALLLGNDPVGTDEKVTTIETEPKNKASPEEKKADEKKKADKKKSAMSLLMMNDPVGTDGLSPFLMCQPCTEEDYTAIAGAEEKVVKRTQEQHMRDLKALYAASQISQDDLPPLDYSDPLLRELQAQYEYEQYTAQQMHYEQQQRQLAEQMEYEKQQQEEYDRIWINAKLWANAFAVDLDAAFDDVSGERKITPSKDTSKSGFGHKETIFGVTFSEDGKYLAAACQDATIGIWEVARNKLVTSLKGHDKNYECLRVDWSSRMWAKDVLDRDKSTRFSNLIASAGADGTVKIWGCADKKDCEVGHREPSNGWKCEYTLDHAKLESMGLESGLGKIAEEDEETEDEGNEDSKAKGDKPQIYALQFIDHWDIFTKNLKDQVCNRHSKQVEKQEQESKEDEGDKEKNSFLMTSSEEFIHLWELESHSLDNQLQLNNEKLHILQDKIKLKEVMSLHFGPLDQYSYGVTVCSVTGTGMKLPSPPSKESQTMGDENGEIAFGGPRNPENTIFVFDAAYCPGSGLLGVALADGSLRLVNGRGACISVIQVPGSKSHLTSFCWDKSGTRLATCVATGHLITWSLDAESHDRGNYNTTATCTAIFEGGHQSGRPLYGSRYCGGEDEHLLLSWGVDGKMCMWYAQSQGNIYDPVAILRDDAGYPIYSAAVSPGERNLVVGGGSDGGFIGVPLHFYGISPQHETAK